jgi:hypothetical protein
VTRTCEATNGCKLAFETVDTFTGGEVSCNVKLSVDACAGAFSGIGLKKLQWGTGLRKKAEQAYNADVLRIRLTGSFSECVAKGVPWSPGEGMQSMV